MKKIFIILMLLASPVWAATVETDSVGLIATPNGDAVNGALVESVTISASQVLVYAPDDTILITETELYITPCQCLVYATDDMILSAVPTIVNTDSVELIASPSGDAVNGAFIEGFIITSCQCFVYATDDMIFESAGIEILPCQSIVTVKIMGNQRKWKQFRSWAGGRTWAGQPGIEWICNKQALMDSN